MAILTQALTADLIDRLGYIPDALPAAIRPLLADQRDQFTWAWINAPEEQHQRPADQWLLPENQRLDFERFRLTMLGITGVPTA